jgi:hypothetical protein
MQRNDHKPASKSVKVTLNRKAFDRYGTGYTLIPLHKPKAVRTFPNGSTKEAGKSPLTRNGRRRLTRPRRRS